MLVVTNPQSLQHGSTPRHRFDRTGGTIGCRAANWILADRQDRIEPIHCEICLEDGHFCVVDRSGQTHINGAHAPIGLGVGARLSEGDTLLVGPYVLTVHLHDVEDASGDPSSSSVDELFGGQGHDLLGAVGDVFQASATPAPMQEGLAAFHALSVPDASRTDLDPLHALDAAEREAAPLALGPLDPTHYGLSPSKSQADLGATRFEAVHGAPPIHSGEIPMTQRRMDTTQAEHWMSTQQSSGGDPRQLVIPLLEGFGTSLGSVDGPMAYRLLLECGQALQAAVLGLTALYRAPAGSDDRLALLGRTLQPIEDNPLRLGLNYEDTARALFGSDRSVVHLSAKAAVEESLAQVRNHQEAIVQAISAGLDALLRSFSPDALLQRFQRYQPDPAQASDTDDWAWRMYTHYFNELASSRQLGFEKLFWEVFEQAYDRALRAEAQ
ncbi:type VI secretion system-associated FHA domain protein TagH [Dyella terrae]|uniref:type VI secretion system-associated FHA domain protein TagH n=1 Tax=Dyella terrae TaxID=522259 RepID=UPI001EFCC881|nr:type VI secretion system-associated FHA domain protein TagH [Dyella terrae]